MKYFLLSLSAIIMLAACQKTPKATVSKENTLRANRWKISSGTLTVKLPSGKDTTIPYVGLLPTCNQDDYLVFDSLDYGAVNSGSIKCSPSEPAEISFTWQLLNNNTILSINNAKNFFYASGMTMSPPTPDTISVNPFKVDTVYKLDYFVGPFDTSAVNATVSNFTDNSFTLTYGIPSEYVDTTLHHAYQPTVLPDTVIYNITYTSF